jgi:hypothetical protein
MPQSIPLSQLFPGFERLDEKFPFIKGDSLFLEDDSTFLFGCNCFHCCLLSVRPDEGFPIGPIALRGRRMESFQLEYVTWRTRQVLFR